ncbi:MAG: zinc ribbon domain-containing protein, partial [Oscillospiraceae bacterium]|nr:zinc ribbon domain-containing protein [Oscillospiraceae bacterium]
ETFEIAQESLKKFSERRNTASHNRPLERRVRCGICGHIMVRSGGKNTYYYCGTPRVTSGYACTTETIPESELMELLLNELRLKAKAAVDVSKLWRERNKNMCESSETILLELSNLREDLSRRDMLLRNLYESFACGVIGKEEYLRKKAAVSKEKNEITDKISKLETHRAKLESSADDSNSFAAAFQRYAGVDKITGDIAREVLDGIVIYPNNRLEITWKFQKEYETLMKQLDTTNNF